MNQTIAFEMDKQDPRERFIRGIPKAELHLHIEGSFEPELMFTTARRNDVRLKYRSVSKLRAAYKFNDLQDFLDIYYEGVNVLIQEQDFYDLAMAYLKKALSQNILHSEIFFDPQAHTSRGIKFETVITGIHRALVEAKEKLGISTGLIMCFLRDKDATYAMKILEEALPYKDWIIAVGLDSYETGNPPAKFKTVFEHALDEGLLTVAHAGEEGPAEYVWQAINLLKVTRIDHGNHSLDDEDLVQELIKRKIPLTVCPLSNLKLKVVKRIEDHPIKEMMRKGLLVTINSDDPAYFGGYINENFLAIQKALKLSKKDIYSLAKNSFEASFLQEAEKEAMIAKLDGYILKMRQNG